MVGLVVAAHGRLAQELVSTAAGIVGALSVVATVSVEAGSPPEVIRDQVRRAVAEVDEGQGVLVLADLFGGTPCKECLMLCGQREIEVLAGVNLPILLKANAMRATSQSLPELARLLALYGQKTITCASELLRDSTAAARQH